MGKVKHRRQRGARYNPTGISHNGSSADEAERDPQVNSPAGLKVIGEKVGCHAKCGSLEGKLDSPKRMLGTTS